MNIILGTYVIVYLSLSLNKDINFVIRNNCNRKIKNYYAKGDSFQSLTLSSFVLQYERTVSFKKITTTLIDPFKINLPCFFFYILTQLFLEKFRD